MAELQPCPFCGGKAAFVPRAVNLALQKDPSDPKFGVSVICGKCGAESPNMVDETHAAGAWNRRATPGVPATLPPQPENWLERSEPDETDRFAMELARRKGGTPVGVQAVDADPVCSHPPMKGPK